MKYPDWFDAVPIFMSDDPEFCVISYHSLPSQNGGLESNITNKKVIADFCDIEHWELIGAHKDFSIFWNIQTQEILISNWEVAWQTKCLSLTEVIKPEQYDLLVKIAQKFIDALLNKGQPQLKLSHV